MAYTPNLPIPNVDYKSPDDFTATYTSSSTITLSGVYFALSNSSQLSYIRVTPTSGKSFYLINGWNITMRYSGGIITIDKTKFASGDVYEVGINSDKRGFNKDSNSFNYIDLNPVWSHYTDQTTLVSSVALGTVNDTWEDKGSEIPMRGYNKLALWVILDVGSNTGNTLQCLMKHTNGGTDEYVLESSSAYSKTLGDSDIKILYEIETDNLVESIQVQTKSESVVDGLISINFGKAYV